MNKKLKLMLVLIGCILFVVIVVFVSKKQYDINQKLEVESSSNMTKINVNELIDLFNSEETKIILVSNIDNQYCLEVKSKINELAGKLNVEVNYLEISTMTDDEKAQLYNSNEFLNQGAAIPLIMAIKNNEVVDSLTGNVKKDELEVFLKNNLNLK